MERSLSSGKFQFYLGVNESLYYGFLPQHNIPSCDRCCVPRPPLPTLRHGLISDDTIPFAHNLSMANGHSTANDALVTIHVNHKRELSEQEIAERVE